MGHFELCHRKSKFRVTSYANALFFLIEAEQAYWRVRAMAARVLGERNRVLNMLLNYFISCTKNGKWPRLAYFNNFFDFVVRFCRTSNDKSKFPYQINFHGFPYLLKRKIFFHR